MKTVAIFLITLYQKTLSPLLVTFLGGRPICRYEVPCSEYVKQMIRRNGVISGILLGGKRVLTCSPFHR